MRFHYLTIAAALAFAPTPAAQAAIIVDTGEPLSESSYVLDNTQSLAVSFSLAEAATITRAEGFITAYTGSFVLSVHADGTNPIFTGPVPAATLYTTGFSASGEGWFGASGLNWDLGPGNYWLSFATAPGGSGGMRYDVPNPQTPGAFSNLVYGWIPSTSLTMGVRIETAGAAVPEPSGWALMIAGFGLVGAVARRRRLAPA